MDNKLKEIINDLDRIINVTSDLYLWRELSGIHARLSDYLKEREDQI